MNAPPFRADHVGSLLRPSALKRAFQNFQQGVITDQEFRQIQDDSIRQVVALQENTGLQSIGDFEPLTAVPSHKTVVLGLISTKTPQLESTDSLRRRLDEAARYLPLEQLALGPQCGFASTVGGNPITEEDEIRKLELVVQTAELVWSA